MPDTEVGRRKKDRPQKARKRETMLCLFSWELILREGRREGEKGGREGGAYHRRNSASLWSST